MGLDPPTKRMGSEGRRIPSWRASRCAMALMALLSVVFAFALSELVAYFERRVAFYASGR